MSIARLSIAVAAALGSSTASASGSIVFDNTLPGQAHGTTTTVPLSAGHYTIDASNTGYLSNTNLFESFATFIVGAAEEADFTNSTHLQIDNVISRVTGIGAPNGLQPTTIDGKVVSTIAGANFWFVNPAGVAIGSGTSINVPAGLAIGTSDFIQFADSSRWYVLQNAAPTPSVLSTASPAAFGFLSTPAAGALTVRSAQLSSATGGNLLLSGGAAGVTVSNSQLTTSNAMGGAASGDIDVTSAGQLTIQNSTLSSETFTAANAGSINLTSNGPMSISGGSSLTSADSGSGQGPAGNISLTAAAMHVAGGKISSSGNAGVVSLTATGTDGPDAPALLVDGGAQIESSLAAGLGFNSDGASGNIQLRAAAGTVTVSGVPGTPSGATILSSSGVGPSASAGSVSLTGTNVSLQGALIETTTGAESGVRPGLVTVNATGNAVLDNTLINTESSGFGTPAGSISISGAGSVSINGGHRDFPVVRRATSRCIRARRIAAMRVRSAFLPLTAW